jgi:hypothetical protein
MALCHEEKGFVELGVDVKCDNMWGGWCSNEVIGSYEVGAWKNIMRGSENSLDLLDLRREIVLRYDFSMMCGVWIRL